MSDRKSDVEKYLVAVEKLHESEYVGAEKKRDDSTLFLSSLDTITSILTESLRLTNLITKRSDYTSNMLSLLLKAMIENLPEAKRAEFNTWLQINGISTFTTLAEVDELLRNQVFLFTICKYFNETKE